MMKATMAKTILAVITAVTLSAPASGAGPDRPGPDVALEAQFLLPQDSDNWNGAFGALAKVRLWQKENFGMAVCMGLQSWQAKSEYTEETDAGTTISSTAYGSMTLLPVGASFLYRNPLTEEVFVTMEAGVRYAFTDSKLHVEISETTAEGTSYRREKILSDSPLLGVLGVSFDASLDDDITVTCGFAYQFDLSKPHERFLGEDMGPVSYKSPMVNLGISWKF